ncbi:MAG: class I SAM-dependent methyltransferase [Pseudomonadota bacterium]
MTDARSKWDLIYADADAETKPLDALLRFANLLPSKGTALDLACGRAANAEFLAQRGLQVSAWDISPVVVAQIQQRFAERDLTVDAQARDVQQQPPEPNSFDVVVVQNFLVRDLAPHIVDALRPQGWLIYQTFVVDKVDSVGPSNPDYLLNTGELLSMFAALTPRAYMDFGSSGDRQTGLRNAALLVAQKPAGQH